MRPMKYSEQAPPSKYLNAADLKNRTHKVVIDAIVYEELNDKDGGKETKPVVYFLKDNKKLAKAWVASHFKLAALAAALGDIMDDWAGNEVELYIESTSMGPGIRCRAVGENAAAAADAGDGDDFGL